MTTNIKLSEGAVGALMRGVEVERPIFQILGFKKISGQGGLDRFRLNISDGVHSHTFAMLATQLNEMIPNGQLDNFCIIRADKIILNAVSEKRVLIILELTVLASGQEIKGKLGNPANWTEGGANAGNPNGNRALRPVQQEPDMSFGRSAFSDRSIAGGGGGAATNVKKYEMSFDGPAGPACPIRDLNPYNNNKIGIKGRVTNKGPIKTWSNSKGEGKLFNMELLDDTGEIRMTGFNQAVDQFYDILKVGSVYQIKNFQVKPANRQFSTLSHDYELSFNNDTQIIPCSDAEATDIPVVSYDFLEIANIESKERDTVVDVIGICKRKGDVQTFTAKASGKELTKRDIVLVDKTQREINLTLWGKQAEEFDDDSNPVIAVKGAKVGDFSGKTLSCMMSSTLVINPDIPEAHMLRGWYDNEGVNLEMQSLSMAKGGQGGAPWKILGEANQIDNVASHDKGDYYMCKVVVGSIKKDNAMYKACPEANCNKKVIDNNNGYYRCEKCGKEYQDFKWRAMVSVNFIDASDNVYATAFQEAAELILENKVETLGPMFNDDPDGFAAIIKESVFKPYIGKFRCKMESYNNENRLKHSVVELHPMSFAEYARKLLNEIKECTA